MLRDAYFVFFWLLNMCFAAWQLNESKKPESSGLWRFVCRVMCFGSCVACAVCVCMLITGPWT